MRDIVRMANRRYKLGIDDPHKAARSPEMIRAVSGCTRFRCRRYSAQPRRSTPIRRRTRTRSTGVTAQSLPSASWDHAYRSSAQLAGPLSAGSLHSRGEDQCRPAVWS
jgi:hypothetical protein